MTPESESPNPDGTLVANTSDILQGSEPSAWIRPLPHPFSHYLAISNDCDSTAFETTEAISEYLQGIGLALSDSFFARTDWGDTISPLIEDRGAVDKIEDLLRSDTLAKFRQLSRSTLLDQIHGVTQAVVAIRWAPIVIYPEGEFVEQTFAFAGQIGHPYQYTNTISFWYRCPTGCEELEISWFDSSGSTFIITTGKLDGGRPGWEISLNPDRSDRIEIDCEESGLRPTLFESITVKLRTRTAAPVVIADFLATNIGRSSIRRVFRTLSEVEIKVPVFTAHGQPDHLTEISAITENALNPAPQKGDRPMDLDFLHFLNSESRSVLHKIRLDRPDARETLYTIFLSTLGRDRGNSQWSPFYCIDILHDYGIRFIRSYFGAMSVPVKLEDFVKEYQKDGHRFYVFRAYSPGEFQETPLNSNLGSQIPLAIKQIQSGPEFSGGALYTHWGVPIEPGAAHVFNDAAQAAFRKLKALTQGPEASLFMRPVSVMLRYATFIRGLRKASHFEADSHVIRCQSWTDPITGETFDADHEFVHGLSFRVSDAKVTRVYWDGVEMASLAFPGKHSPQTVVIQILGKQ